MNYKQKIEEIEKGCGKQILGRGMSLICGRDYICIKCDITLKAMEEARELTLKEVEEVLDDWQHNTWWGNCNNKVSDEELNKLKQALKQNGK